MSMLKFAYQQQIQALERANEEMTENWGTYTNKPGFKFCESQLAKTLANSDYVSPWGKAGCYIKPVLKDMYIAMTNEMISSLKLKISEIQDEEANS